MFSRYKFQDNRLQSGDHILQIGDVNLRGMGSEQVAAVLRQSGTHVRLVVARPVEPTSPDYQVFFLIFIIFQLHHVMEYIEYIEMFENRETLQKFVFKIFRKFEKFKRRIEEFEASIMY